MMDVLLLLPAIHAAYTNLSKDNRTNTIGGSNNVLNDVSMITNAYNVFTPITINMNIRPTKINEHAMTEDNPF